MLCVLKIRELFICVVLLGSLAWDSEEECVWSVTLLDSISQMVKQSKHTEGQGILRPRPHGAMRTDTRPWCMTGEPTFFCVELRSQGTAHALFNPSLLDFASQPCILIGIFSLCDIIILLSKEESYWKKFPGAPALGLWHVGWWKNRYLSLFFDVRPALGASCQRSPQWFPGWLGLLWNNQANVPVTTWPSQQRSCLAYHLPR